MKIPNILKNKSVWKVPELLFSLEAMDFSQVKIL